jgi:hypothetical protein
MRAKFSLGMANSLLLGRESAAKTGGDEFSACRLAF